MTQFCAPVVRPEQQLELVPEALLTVKNVAQRLGISTKTVYKLCYSGALPHVRIIGSIRVQPADLDAFVAARGKGK
ncbi:MAG: helix-turn-helix domain-containing protein [Deltaproteobacteria bacterium]|nr:helix-turn-helix domain-containing protein [Deltaproteobacteria bacterium]